MYVVTGATGRVGSAVARHLLDHGAKVRVLVRRPAAAPEWAARGADVRVADLRDRAALAASLTGCAGFFTLLPFDLTAADPSAHAAAVVAATAAAVADARVPHVVVLSSGGADLAAGTGPVAGLHALEQALLASGATVTALRSGHFQEKVTDALDLVREQGVYPVLAASADVALPMGATRDLGAVAAGALLSPPASSEAVDVLGPATTEREVAAVLAAALGRDVDVVTVPEEAWVETLAGTGLPVPAAESLAELYRADKRGLLAPRGDRAVHLSTPIARTVSELVGAAPAAVE
ncbi:Uncharacterized conserved protein YbjT, contains NAD(P)-binding and DUF2867 domains [Georgenia satyanarayanai]|uniref:Uncharacterized conserved protein YbjT, contains NAD(P)-binding and DUF2867 domains n=1 Tax=Georgenia satyanarayanai TaxID=860221 RepID=A0A2Y9APZ1_9MICO|nr:NmrA family NAD(P)-binding protein [Georgenia satyanarayanai]PYF96738.1 uncharacterized protein YbjT (DUF2867 family) [Georgenia satyanarayanai]SSA46480.1 Uncharacterized conserved protein YbjT, contains NAD(P)-binding and DUF2867 domains [Georgenia satyanarayanai]